MFATPLRRILLLMLSLILVLVVAIVAYMRLAPQFGALPSKAQQQAFQALDNHNGSEFINRQATETMSADVSALLDVLWQYLKGNDQATPAPGTVVAQSVSAEQLRAPIAEPQLLWFGHSTLLIQTKDLNLLFDPMFSSVPAPHPWLGTRRYSGNLPIEVENLPKIDAVFISHDHYDHLDYDSILQLAGKTERFFVPLGVAAHLQRWHIGADKIHEFNWWQEAQLGPAKLAFTPARHFSGRGLGQSNRSLWGGWWLETPELSLLFSGDSGYGDHFKEIQQRYGAVDLAILESGQYHQHWADIHMLPEQAVQAAQDLQAKLLMPIHWGAFTLALHDWNEPALRVQAAAQQANQALLIPEIGELVLLRQEPIRRQPWYVTIHQ